MTSKIRGRFRRLLIAGAAVPAVAGLAVGLTAASASASTAAPGYGHQRCDETLVYRASGYGDPRGHEVIVRDVCHVRINEYGHYGRDNEVVSYDQARHGHLEFHIVFGVSDAEVFGY